MALPRSHLKIVAFPIMKKGPPKGYMPKNLDALIHAPKTLEWNFHIAESEMGEKNHRWKGDEASYRAKHAWVERRLGKPDTCDHCGNSSLRHRQYHWANLSGLYKRELSDWARLCSFCHSEYDKKKRWPNHP